MCKLVTSLILGTLVPPAPSGDFGIGLEQLASVTRDHNFSALEQYGGVRQLRMDFFLVCHPVVQHTLHNAWPFPASG